MKLARFIFIFIFLHLSLNAIGQSVNESIVFDEKIHDFGSVDETGGKVKHRFRFTNKGSKPVTIVRARAGCSCVSIDIPRKAIAPGQSDYITVSFDPDYRPGHFSKEIVIYSNENRYNRIWVKGDVKPGKHKLSDNYRYDLGNGILSNYIVMNFATVAPKNVVRKKLSVANNSDRTVRLDFQVENNDPTVSVDSGCILAPQADTSVTVIVAPKNPLKAPKKVKIYPIANGTRLQPIEITFKTSYNQ